MTVAGPIESISIDGREFSVASDAETNREIGGFVNEQAPNGNGTTRKIKTRKPWMVDGFAISTDDLLDDQEYLQAKSDQAPDYPIVITYSSGAVWGGTGSIVDEVKFSSASATTPITVSGPLKLTQQ